MAAQQQRLAFAATALALTVSLLAPPPSPSLAREHLQDPPNSAMAHFLRTADDDAFIKFLRFDRHTFQLILTEFAPLFEATPLRPTEGEGIYPIQGRVQVRALDSPQTLALILRFLAAGTTSDDQLLQMGIVQATRSQYLRQGLLTLLTVLRNWPPARITMPTVDEARQMAAAAAQWDERIQGCFGVIDGTVHRRERPADDQIQRLHYNGMDSCHAAKSLVVYGFTGEILYIVCNDYGSSSDAGMLQWSGFLRILQQYPPDLCIAGDSAFPASANLIRVLDNDELAQFPQVRSDLEALNGILKGIRMAAEWGLKQWKGCWRVFHQDLPAESDRDPVYRAIFEISARLTNVRVRLMGISQIFNVFQRT